MKPKAIHPNNTLKSTITVADIVPVAQKYTELFIKGLHKHRLLRYLSPFYTLEDVTMDAVERVIKANPMYLTKSYVRTAVNCTCLDLIRKHKLPWSEHSYRAPADPTKGGTITSAPSDTDHDGPAMRIEETIEGDIYDILKDLEEEVRTYLGPLETQVLDGLLSRKLYIEIAADMGIAVRTLERHVNELKWKLYKILKEED